MNGELDAALASTVQKMLGEIQGWDPDQLLTQSENEIAAYLAEKYTANCPVLRRDELYADEPDDVTQTVRGFDRNSQVPATRLLVHVPYEGERIFFSLKPNTFTFNPPRVDVTDAELILTFEDRTLDGEQIRSEIDHNLGEIERWLTSSRQMAEAHNKSLLNLALSTIRQRKEKLLGDRQTVAGLGIPVRRRGDPPSYSVPVTRRKPTVTRVPAPTSASYEPEPTLSDSDYEEAVRIITNFVASSSEVPRRRFAWTKRNDATFCWWPSILNSRARPVVRSSTAPARPTSF